MTECALVALRAAGQRARASERATVESARLPTVCPCGAPTRRGGVLHPARKAAWRASRQGRHSLPGRAESLPRALHPLRRAPAAPCRASARATTWTTPPSARMGGSSRCGGGGRRLGRARARARGTSGPAAKPATPRARRARESSAWSTPSAWTGIHRACVRSGGGGRQSGEVGHPKMREIFALAPSSSPCTRGLTPASLPSQVEYAAKAVDNSKYVCTTLRAARGLALLPRSLRLLAARAPRSSMPALRKRGQRRGMPRRWPLCLPDTLWEVRLALARRALLHFAGWAGRARDERAAECQTDPRLRPISGVLPPPTLTRCASSTPLCLVSLSARRWASAARMAWCSACRRRC